MIIQSFLNALFKKMYREKYIIQLLCHAHLKKDKSKKKETTQLLESHNFNWKTFIQLVHNNKLYKVVVETLEYLSLSEKIPNQIYKKILKGAFTADLYSSKHAKETTTILKDIYAHNLKAVVMKSYAMTQFIFETTGFKTTLDVDLLISIYDFKKVSKILLQQDYLYFQDHHTKRGTEAIPNPDFYHPKSQEIFKKGTHTIELHTTIVDTFDWFALPIINQEKNKAVTQELFSKTQEIQFQDIKALVFSPEALVISLFLHMLFQHNLQIGISHYEFAKIITILKSRLNWKYIHRFTEKYNLAPYFLWFLLLLESQYPQILPKQTSLKVSQFNDKLKIHHRLLLFYMKKKILNPTKFLEGINKEREKEWCWAIIGNNLKRTILRKIIRKLPYNK